MDALNEVGARWPAAGTCLAVKLDDAASLAAAQQGARLVQNLGVHHERQVWWALPANPDERNPREAMR